MAKRYTDELAKWVEDRADEKRLVEEALVSFVACRDDISEALSAGYAMKTVWEHLKEKGRIKSGYQTFRKHVRDVLHHEPGKQGSPLRSTSTPTSSTPAAVPKPVDRRTKVVPAAPQAESMGGFSFNPSPNKEELL